MKFQGVMGLIITLASIGCQTETENVSQVTALEDIRNMSMRSDGRFDVTCQDGTNEVRSAEDIRADRVCEGGNSGGSGYICAARDNDGRDPWIVARLGGGGVTRFSNVIFGDIDQCREALRSKVELSAGTYLCGSSDQDGRDPWGLYYLTSRASNVSGIKYGMIGQCTRAMAVAGGEFGTVSVCSARDNDGRDPWNIFTMQNGNATRTDVSYDSFDACESAMASTSGEGLICAARDNDGRDPWILADAPGQGSERYSNAVFGPVEDCESAVRTVITLQRDLRWACASRDRDGRSPFALVKLTGAGVIETNAIYGELGQCVGAAQSAQVNSSEASICSSRDRDGRDPWNIYNLSASGVVQTDLSYSSFDACRSALGRH